MLGFTAAKDLQPWKPEPKKKPKSVEPAAPLSLGRRGFMVLATAAALFAAAAVTKPTPAIAADVPFTQSIKSGFAVAPGEYNIAHYGAVPWITQTAADVWPGVSLANLQASYILGPDWTPISLSFITNTTNTTAWIAYNCASVAATSSGNGGLIRVPAGRFPCDQKLPDLTSTISPPQTTAHAISIKGAGSASSSLWLTREITSTRGGDWFLSCASRGTAGSSGFIQGISFVGTPTGNGGVWGAPLGYTSGIAWGARRIMDDVLVQGFYDGISITGDQTQISNCVFENCTYGLRWDITNPILFGDMIFTKCIMQTCSIAAVAASHHVGLPKVHFIKCLLGDSPYSLYKETNGGAPDTAILFTDCVFTDCQFENVGNGIIADDQTASGNTLLLLTGVNKMTNCQFGGFQPGRKISTAPQAAMLNIFNIPGGSLTIDGINNIGLWTPGTLGMMAVTFGQVIINADIDAFIAQANSATGSNKNRINTGSYDFIIMRDYNWEGHFAYGGAGNVGDYVSAASGSRGTALPVGSLADTRNGVMMWRSGDQLQTLIAHSGVVTVRTDGTVALGPLRTSSSSAGALTQATGANDTNSTVVANCEIGRTGAGTTTASLVPAR